MMSTESLKFESVFTMSFDVLSLSHATAQVFDELSNGISNTRLGKHVHGMPTAALILTPQPCPGMPTDSQLQSTIHFVRAGVR